MKHFIYFLITLLLLVSCKKAKNEKDIDISDEKVEIQNNFRLNENDIEADIHVKYNKNKDTMNYVSIKYLNDSIPDSLYLYPIRVLFIKESFIKYREDFFKQLEILGFSDTKLNEQLNIDSTFKHLKDLQIINPLSKITNSEIRLDEFEYWVEFDIDRGTSIPFSFDLNKMRVDSTMYIVSPLEEIIIPSNKKYRKVIFCTKSDQFERLNAEYEFVDTLYCHKMRERQAKAKEATK